ncbi:hypothetical protein [Candidatus Pantoea multigeneris]|uniref:Uncharacterized protein n=1 Tax=Candidatus Pantoea multigeneris TaxID=2608357 RepID=A0ABX0RKU1_9GAMM|nr:hypothetical protein [Pantoea multigeneris]NIF23965.1 hypothetical protein [Pantoea multigeneris]
MSKLYRVALPGDYVYNPETCLWELSFDKRPVAGAQAASPEEGATKYNAERQKFMAAVSASRLPGEPVFSFTEMTEWVVEYGTADQCQAVLLMFDAKDKAEFDFAVREGLRVLPPYLDFVYFFGQYTDRMCVLVSLRERLRLRLS